MIISVMLVYTERKLIRRVKFEKAPKASVQERKIRVTFLPAEGPNGVVCETL
jgi:hypothetical protein